MATEIDETTKQLLQKLGFTEVEQNNFCVVGDDNIEAHVDFRKENGRRWARKANGEFIKAKDIDTVPILKQFKEERDKILQSQGTETKEESTSSLDVEPETILNNQSSIHTPPDVKSVPAPNSPNLYEFFYELVGAGGIIEIFGDTGSLKSQLCTETCKDATKLGKKYYYLDTEGKVGLFNKKNLGSSYQYLPVWDEILKKLKSDLPKGDLLIVDSIGFPISTEYADMKANQQGDTLQDMMAAVGKHLKVWAYKNNAIVIFTNQPKSTFMKSDEELDRLSAFGDKVHFAPNIILKTTKSIIPGHYDQVAKKVIPPKSIGNFTSFRSTDFMDDVDILTITKNDNEVIIGIPAHVTKRLQELRG